MSAKMNKDANASSDSITERIASDQELFQEFIRRSIKFRFYKSNDLGKTVKIVDFPIKIETRDKSKPSDDTDKK